VISDLRARGRELREVLDRLDGLLGGKDADKLPGMLVAELLLAVDRAGKRLTKLADQLAAAASRNGQGDSQVVPVGQDAAPPAAPDPEGDTP
jgi:hypothetical protein